MTVTLTLDDYSAGIIVDALNLESMERREDAVHFRARGLHDDAISAIRAARDVARVRRHIELAAGWRTS